MVKIVDSVRAHGKDCIGCKSYERDVMISFGVNKTHGHKIHDFFLTNEQAKQLVQELQVKIMQNENK